MTENSNYVYISIIAIVAIVAMVVLFNGNGIAKVQNTPSGDYNAMDGSNIGGQATQASTQTSRVREVIQTIPGLLELQKGYCKCSDTLQARCTIDGRVTDCVYCCEQAKELTSQES